MRGDESRRRAPRALLWLLGVGGGVALTAAVVVDVRSGDAPLATVLVSFCLICWVVALLATSGRLPRVLRLPGGGEVEFERDATGGGPDIDQAARGDLSGALAQQTLMAKVVVALRARHLLFSPSVWHDDYVHAVVVYDMPAVVVLVRSTSPKRLRRKDAEQVVALVNRDGNDDRSWMLVLDRDATPGAVRVLATCTWPVVVARVGPQLDGALEMLAAGGTLDVVVDIDERPDYDEQDGYGESR